MFTGIIAEVGRVVAVLERGPGVRLEVAAGEILTGTTVGDSIAVNGVCLTITDRSPAGFAADVMAESLRATALGSLAERDLVNLERPLLANGRFDGHIVQGHVDAVGTVSSIEAAPNATTVWVDVPPDVLRYCVRKGSVTIDGISLTIVDVADDVADAAGVISVSIIPHTWENTNLRSHVVGSRVNVEVDVLAKYVERLLFVHKTEGA